MSSPMSPAMPSALDKPVMAGFYLANNLAIACYKTFNTHSRARDLDSTHSKQICHQQLLRRKASRILNCVR